MTSHTTREEFDPTDDVQREDWQRTQMRNAQYWAAQTQFVMERTNYGGPDGRWYVQILGGTVSVVLTPTFGTSHRSKMYSVNSATATFHSGTRSCEILRRLQKIARRIQLWLSNRTTPGSQAAIQTGDHGKVCQDSAGSDAPMGRYIILRTTPIRESREGLLLCALPLQMPITDHLDASSVSISL